MRHASAPLGGAAGGNEYHDKQHAADKQRMAACENKFQNISDCDQLDHSAYSTSEHIAFQAEAETQREQHGDEDKAGRGECGNDAHGATSTSKHPSSKCHVTFPKRFACSGEWVIHNTVCPAS